MIDIDQFIITVLEVAEGHEPMEATGGYIECGCGWPSFEQWESGEHYIAHILDAARDRSAESLRLIANRHGIRTTGEDVDILTGKRFAPEPRLD